MTVCERVDTPSHNIGEFGMVSERLEHDQGALIWGESVIL